MGLLWRLPLNRILFAPIIKQWAHEPLGESCQANRMNVVGPQVRKIRESKDMTEDDLVVHCNLQKWDISRSTLAKIE